MAWGEWTFILGEGKWTRESRQKLGDWDMKEIHFKKGKIDVTLKSLVLDHLSPESPLEL